MAESSNPNNRIRIIAEFDDPAVYDPAVIGTPRPRTPAHPQANGVSHTEAPAESLTAAELEALILDYQRKLAVLNAALRTKRGQSPGSE
jgi:hypothetical protein